MIQAAAADNTAKFKTSPDLLGALIGDGEDRCHTVSCRVGRLRSLIATLAETPAWGDDVKDALWVLYEQMEMIEAIAVGAVRAEPGWGDLIAFTVEPRA